MIATKKVKAIFWPWLLILAWEKFYDIGARFWNFFLSWIGSKGKVAGKKLRGKKSRVGDKSNNNTEEEERAKEVIQEMATVK